MVKSLSAQVCALDTRMSNLYQLFGRTRNRLTIIEDTVNNLPEDEELGATVGCGGLENTSEADAVLVCEDGAQKAFVAGGEPEEIVFCDGKARKVPKGLGWHPLATKQLILTQSNMASNNVPVSLPEFPSDVCTPVWALFNSTGQAFPGGSGSGTQVQLHMNGNELFISGFFGDYSFCQAMVSTPTASNTLQVVSSGSGVRSFICHLLGYFY